MAPTVLPCRIVSTGGIWTVVVAAGSGRRFGRAKQFERLDDRRVVDWALDTARRVSDGVVLVLPADAPPEVGSVPGGVTRSDSVRRGLAAVPHDAAIICVHDGARPFATPELYALVIDAVNNGADAAVPAVGVTDTIKQVDAQLRVVATPDRSTLWAVQTPQAFRADVLRRVHAGVNAEATDDAALVEHAGGTVVVVSGDVDNVKITHPEDLTRARDRVAGGMAVPFPEIRVGQGVDVHRFTDDPNRVLVLGGCTFPGERGLAGHSDADVVAHAVAEALLGAAGLGDLGEHFPDTDERFRGADSLTLLRHVVDMVTAQGWTIGNVDADVMCEAPKLAPRRAEMRDRLTSVVGAPVTVAGRRAEGLGSLGRREGIACWAVAVIMRVKGTH
jgi:2-C-methyl-D-erythritol 4-phosphate cytidylyltransferase / 2-C-methyl-D-erythritol 2,4-cyclodiphosphate synthase